MEISHNIPQKDTLKDNQFKFTLTRIPNCTYHLQSFIIPPLDTGASKQAYPDGRINFPNVNLEYGEITMVFLVDRDLRNYIEIKEWIESNVKTNFSKESHQSEGTIHILRGNLNPTNVFRFHDMFPISLSEIPFTSSNATIDDVTCSVVFAYNYFTVE